LRKAEGAYMGKHLYGIPVLIIMLFVNIGLAMSENADSIPEPRSYYIADIKQGGLLYDNWVKIKKVEITKRHPLYPQKEKIEASKTWRCKECHGWDYLGDKGRYSDGTHYTGIKGIFDARNKTPEELFDALTNKSIEHDFTENLNLSYSDTWALVRFIKEGLIDINSVTHSNGTIKGNPENGRVLYLRHCHDCHGNDGNKINFREHLEGTHGIGWESNGDPQETLHKIRWGHPGVDKPSMIADKKLSDNDTVDILFYCQTLYP
jgi:thiosulfate dehydrogenase